MSKGNGAPRKRRGRPSLPPKKGKRYPLSLRTTDELKERLRTASHVSGRSIAQEVEFRLEQSFRDQDRVERHLEFAYGRQNAAVVMLLGRALIHSSTLSEILKEPLWLDDHVGFDIVAGALKEVLRKLRPGGETSYLMPVEARQKFIEGRGTAIADGIIGAFLAGRDSAGQAQEMLGPKIRDRVSARTVFKGDPG